MADKMRLIDANALKDFLCEQCYIEFADEVCVTDDCHIRNAIMAAPTIEAEPVRHGKIIETIENGKMKRVFSCCNTDFTQLTMWITPNYCPNCGAKMDEEG